MNEHAKQWVKALRSGEYKQGVGRLNKGGTFCCLGVACELFNQANPGKLEIGRFNIELEIISYDGVVFDLPSQVQQWLGLETSMGRYMGGTLAELNDRGMSFGDIADLIESEPVGLFKEESQ